MFYQMQETELLYVTQFRSCMYENLLRFSVYTLYISNMTRKQIK